MKERRRFIRLTSSVSVNYKKIKSTKDEIESVSKNICEKGICIVTKEELQVGDMLDLTIAISEYKMVISVKGKVVWVKENQGEDSSEPKTYSIGIEFSGVSKEASSQIEDYIHASLFNNI
ncbi:MAG: hypothetical protein DRZ76_00265 [Candidatus Nealsonbacteria bacterium]|nr:MAG: hypothetical protein DRZ76_00265 [Candidatus Nealsonbacteria bacterium]